MCTVGNGRSKSRREETGSGELSLWYVEVCLMGETETRHVYLQARIPQDFSEASSFAAETLRAFMSEPNTLASDDAFLVLTLSDTKYKKQKMGGKRR